MKDRVLSILGRVLEMSVDESASQESIGKWDSMSQLNIAFEIESEFGISLEPEEIAQMKSVGEIIEVLASHGV